MAKRMLLCIIMLVLAAAPAAARDRDKVNVCHFPASGEVQLVSIARSALPAHLAHGDVEAPPSVRTAPDCLIPQAPPEPVAATATTDVRGTASFVIPNTNVIARFEITSNSGAPIVGAIAQVSVIGEEYLAVIVDASQQFAPAIAGGKLSEARAGSPLMLLLRIVLLTYSTRLSGGAMLTPGPALPPLTGAHFTAAEYCFTEQELQAYVERVCNGVAGFTAGMFFPLLIGKGTVQTATTLFYGFGPLADACEWLAPHITAASYSGRSLPVKFRVFSSVAIAGMQFFPYWFQDAGDCGGACCDGAGNCTLVSDPSNCITRYLPLTPCNPSPCPTGACCNASLNCTIVTRAECEAIGGDYKGDNVPCSPDPCPSGACCHANGCTDMPAYLCGSMNSGTFHGNGTSCTRASNQPATVFTLTSGRDTGGTGFAVPFPGGRIRTTITIPSNMIRGSGTTGDCGRGDVRVELRVCPRGAGCSGITWYAGHHIAICHDFTETLTFEMLNPNLPCSSFSFNAITEKVSTAVVEVLPP